MKLFTQSSTGLPMKNSTLLWIVAALAILNPGIRAQLNGLYTIDNSLPTAGINFNSLSAAVLALSSQGATGPVAFLVNNSGTPYAGFSIQSPIAGVNATNTVTFSGVGRPVINSIATGFVQAVRFGTSSVTATGGPTDIVFEGFEVTGATTGAGIIATQCDRITIRDCIVHTSGSGICFNASRFCSVSDCEIYGVGNTVGTPGSVTYSGALTSYYNNNNFIAQRNRIHDNTGNGIFIGSSGTTTTPTNNVIVNNFVWGTPGAGTYQGGLVTRGATNAVIANNSISMPAASANPGINMAGTLATYLAPAEISNNIVQLLGTGPCIRFESGLLPAPAVMDFNVYDPAPTANIGAIGITLVPTLPAWQGTTSPNLAGKEVNTFAGSAGFFAPNDLHILPNSPGFNSGTTVAQVAVDIDLQARPIGNAPDRGADEALATGLVAVFALSMTTGPAPAFVSFTDLSFSQNGPITSWSWDFDNNGTIDSTQQNPTNLYFCPGVYSVALTVTNGIDPPSTLVRSNVLTVSNHRFDLATTGGGVGDLTVTPVPTLCGGAATATSGYTLVSFNTNQPLGTGPAFGLWPDPTFFTFLFSPAAPGNVLHFNVTPGLYPDAGAVIFPPGFFAALNGATMDAVMVFLGPTSNLLYVSNADRVTF